MADRYEILPFGNAESEAAAVRAPLTLTVTSSPRQSVEHTVDLSSRIAALGHRAVPHLAARMVHDAAHLDELLQRLAAARLDDVFLVAGDSAEPTGAYASAVDLLPALTEHPLRPTRIGIAGYPEGHPLVDIAELDAALARKAPLADYLVTQMCFDADVVVRWIERTRAAGIELPVYVGLPGVVDRRRLLEVSMRIGVGRSISFLRKQRGIRHLIGHPHHATDRLHAAIAPLIADRTLGIAGMHYFTFNRLEATLAWKADAQDAEMAADA